MQKVYSKYKTDGGQVFPVLIAPRTIQLAFGSTINSATESSLSTDVTLKIRRDVSEFGITSRKVLLRWAEEAPFGYNQSAAIYVPILTPELFAAIERGQGGVYVGKAVVVAKKIRERFR